MASADGRVTTVLKPPTPFQGNELGVSVFLAGSIEMGKAEDWQTQVINSLKEQEGAVTCTVLNPRRDDWDSSWVQSIENPQFREQVEWELNAMDAATLIIMNFCPETQSPITLLELGLHARSGKLVVCCPKGFWRRGNVEVVCQRFGIKLVESFDELIEYTKAYLRTK